MLKLVAKGILGAVGLREAASLSRDALQEYGWARSARESSSIDRDGNPIPWITYPAIELLGQRLTPDLKVFEFGCGNSSLWLSRRVSHLESVEHDRAWYDKIKQNLPPNTRIRYVALSYGGEYCKSVLDGSPWDLVIVDGRDRVNCMRAAAANLSERGVIVLDNSDRAEYDEGIKYLEGVGLKHLPLRGLAPIVTYVSQTSFFYRDGNCLGL